MVLFAAGIIYGRGNLVPAEFVELCKNVVEFRVSGK